jgi:hypothetical protein
MQALASEERIISFEDTDGCTYVDKQRIQAVLLNPETDKRTIGY